MEDDIDINLIKFMCDKSGVFQAVEGSSSVIGTGRKPRLMLPNYVIFPLLDLNRKKIRSFKEILFPLLLSKTFDDINETDTWKIDLYYDDDDGGWSWSYKDYTNGVVYRKADAAREAAIRYYMGLTIRKEGGK